RTGKVPSGYTAALGRLSPVEPFFPTACLTQAALASRHFHLAVSRQFRWNVSILSRLSCVEWLLRLQPVLRCSQPSFQQRLSLQPSVRDLAAPEHASFALMCHLKIRGRRECRALDAPAASHAK